MRTVFSDSLRRHHLDQSINNLLREGFVLVHRTDFEATLLRRKKHFLAKDEHITLAVDAYGQVQRSSV